MLLIRSEWMGAGVVAFAFVILSKVASISLLETLVLARIDGGRSSMLTSTISAHPGLLGPRSPFHSMLLLVGVGLVNQRTIGDPATAKKMFVIMFRNSKNGKQAFF